MQWARRTCAESIYPGSRPSRDRIGFIRAERLRFARAQSHPGSAVSRGSGMETAESSRESGMETSEQVRHRGAGECLSMTNARPLHTGRTYLLPQAPSGVVYTDDAASPSSRAR